MQMMKKITFLVLLLCLSGFGVKAQDSPMTTYANGIQAEPLKKHLSVLASDEYEGRETGEKGQKMAAEYIRKHFKEIGLEGPVKEGESPYFQTFNLFKNYWESCNIKTAKGNELKLFEDFFPYGRYTFGTKDFDVVFAGYGLDTETYSDYAGIDVEGKAVVIIEGEPQKEDGTYWVSGTEEESSNATSFAKIKLAKDKGASLIIIAYKHKADFSKRNAMFKAYYAQPTLGFDKPEEEAEAGLAFSTFEAATQILNTKVAKLEKLMAKMDGKGKSTAGKLKATITVDPKLKKEPVATENVLGYLEGTDKKEELLVITAHYDHVGIINGEIHNGADDDGSGTVAVLEIAKAFAKAKAEGKGPRRSILFMTVTGEEKGLLGSEYYADHPIFPIENTVVNLNTDMVGRVDKAHEGNPNYVYVIGSDMLSTDLHSLHEEIAKRHFPEMELDYTYNSENDPNRYYYRSDHYNFAKNNIPVIFYFNGTHEDYHKPTDTVEKINFDKIAKIAQLNFCTAWVIANREARLVVDKAAKE